MTLTKSKLEEIERLDGCGGVYGGSLCGTESDWLCNSCQEKKKMSEFIHKALPIIQRMSNQIPGMCFCKDKINHLEGGSCQARALLAQFNEEE